MCRLLGLGLLGVTVSSGRVEVLAEPSAYKPRLNVKRRARILKEHGRRLGDPAVGGSTRQPIMTAYRQRALDCLDAMREGPRRPRDLKDLAEDARAILARNVYGWFERVSPGVYRLTEAGGAVLEVARPVTGEPSSNAISGAD